LEYFVKAKAQGDLLFLIVNSDHQRALKGTKEFQKEEKWIFIIQYIKVVNQTFLSIDQDRTVCKTFEYLLRS
jgi:bifunctional ADP-heptose synthase (sugar kinase/adenylyltransferase)